MTLALLLTLLQAPAPAPDTALVVQGILVPVGDAPRGPATWAVQLLQPITLGALKTNVLELVGNPRSWMRFADRWVEVRGRPVVAPGGGRFAARLEAARVTAMTPPGLVERRVRLSHTQHAIVTLAVVPHAIRLGGADGAGTRPVVLYTIQNIGTTDLEFHFPSTKAVCITVESRSGRPWEDPSLVRQQIGSTVVIRMGVLFRQMLPLPAEATPEPGVYVVRASLCGVTDYEVTTDLEVIAQ